MYYVYDRKPGQWGKKDQTLKGGERRIQSFECLHTEENCGAVADN